MQVLLPNQVARECLRCGDHIFAYGPHDIASHGIYDGEGQVIQFISSPLEYSISPTCPQCHNNPNPNSNSFGVTVRCIECFLTGTSPPYIFNYSTPPHLFLARARGGTCTLAASDPVHIVMHRALQLLQNGVVSVYGSYFINSCEDFAVYCKTGLLVVGGAPRSAHAAAALTATTMVAASPLRRMLGFVGSALVGVSVHCVTRLAEDVQVRRDVIKDAVKVDVEKVLDGSVPSAGS